MVAPTSPSSGCDGGLPGHCRKVLNLHEAHRDSPEGGYEVSIREIAAHNSLCFQATIKTSYSDFISNKAECQTCQERRAIQEKVRLSLELQEEMSQINLTNTNHCLNAI